MSSGGRERGKNVDLIRTRGFRGHINCSVFTPLYKEGIGPDGTEKIKLEERKFTYRRPKFNGLKRPDGLRPLQFVEMVEECANLLCDPFSAAEAYDVENGLIPKRRINRIFDSLKISYGNHAVPLGRKRLKKGIQLFQRGRRRMLRGPLLVIPKVEATESEEIYDIPWVYDDSRGDGLAGMFLEL